MSVKTGMTGEQGSFYDFRAKAENGMKPISKRLPHPNVITGRWRTSAAAVGLVSYAISPITGSVAYGVNGILDWFDGMSARENNQRTREGERLDPMVDKLINSAYLLYLACMNLENVAFDIAAGLNIAVDVNSQKSRGPLLEQLKEGVEATVHPHDCEVIPAEEKVNAVKANFMGKLKFFIQNAAILGMMLGGDNEIVSDISSLSLYGSAALGMIGTLQRNKLKKTLSESE
jgi:phosphatidylglycerophosphate synthase